MTLHPEVEQSWNPQERWPDIKEILSSARDALEAHRRFAEKHLINGRLLVTPAQFAELHRVANQREAQDLALGGRSIFVPRPKWTDINVVVVSGIPVDVGGGKKAVCFNNTIYVFTEVDWKARITAPLSIFPPDMRYPPLS